MNNWVKDKPKITLCSEKGIYKADEITDALQRIKAFLVEQNIKLVPAEKKDIEEFERNHQIVLPLAYRRFLLEITDGINEDVPFGISKLIGRDITGSLSTPFPLKNFGGAEGETELDNDLFKKALEDINGCGQLSLDKEECLWSLIVSGECYGEVWNVGNWNTLHFTSLLFPRRDFLSWLEWCIKDEIDINNGNDVAEKGLCFPDDFWDKYGEYSRS